MCVCTSDGALRFFATVEEEDSTEEKEDIDDVNMVTEMSSSNNVHAAPSTSSCSITYQYVS